MSQSHRIPLKGGREQDMLTGWRQVMFCDYGRSKRAKQSYNRRQRRVLKQALREED